MYKEVTAIVLLSILILLTGPHVAQGLKLILDWHDQVNGLLSYVFSSGEIGKLISDLVAMLALPFIVSGVIAAVYYIFRRHLLPQFMLITWAIWLVQTTAITLYT